MDTDEQLHELDARGWRRGLYADVKRTFRAPIVNWIFRTTMANEPAFLRHAWGQVKPVFQTRAFARLTVRYRDAVLEAMDDAEPSAEDALATYRPGDVGLEPAAYRELRGQLATYDVVAPRLAVLFETMDRALHDEPVGHAPAEDRAATEPFPDWLDADRGRAPTLLDAEDVPDSLSDTVDAVQTFHGFDDQLPSIYRTLAQWPSFFERMWADTEPRLESDAFETACERTDDLVSSFVDTTPYRPRLAPADLERAGFDDETISSAQALFRQFNGGPVQTVLPGLPVFAATVGASGERDLL
ncbi:halocarboxylic acid dehydrogenase DehI family protein [Halogeometricum limi]|uniref:Halocarboxylic acid dehydrogenase DehI n=1 Tax=Halogeometricum limi TaxID=555875 RepID=A0A1I6G3K2_9EURY|nr:halocarboxylic acid dehydrogenase DehI family protein [Halogeometricum limi]SFR36793.1 Halocarboxylic acid dehydrogenase DehI [Halogeometricum limi]